MKKMKTRTKLVGAVAALTVAVALSAGTTFAWFTSNPTSTISNISANVTTGGSGNIMVAVGHSSTGSFKTGLDTDDIGNYLNVAFDALCLDTTDNNLEDVDGNNAVAASGTTGSSYQGEYIKIPLTIRTDSADSIVLTESSSVTGTASSEPTNITAWRTIEKNKYGNSSEITQDGAIEASAYNAARVGFTVADSSDNSTDYAGNPIYTGTEGTMKVWSPNEAMYSGAIVEQTGTEGAAYSLNTNVDRSSVAVAGSNYWQNNLAGDYYYYMNSNTNPTNYSTGGYSNYLTNYTENSSNATIVETAKVGTSSYAYAFIYVYVWIDGNDGDCFNSIFDQNIVVNLAISTLTEMTGGGSNP